MGCSYMPNRARIDIGSSGNLSNLDLSLDTNSTIWTSETGRNIFGMN